MTLPTRTLKEIARQAAEKASPLIIPSVTNELADAVAIAVLREAKAQAEKSERICRELGLQADLSRADAYHNMVIYYEDRLAEFDAPGAQERTTEKDFSAGLAAVGNDTGPSTTETARERIIVKGAGVGYLPGAYINGVAIRAAREALTILQERIEKDMRCRHGKPEECSWRHVPHEHALNDVCELIGELTVELSDSAPVVTAKPADSTRRSAAQGSSSHSSTSLTEET